MAIGDDSVFEAQWERFMGHLDKLTITRRVINAAKPRRVVDTVEYRRNKLIANLEEQIELANLAIADKPLVLKRKRGSRVAKVRPRLWWKVDEDGHTATEVRYNKTAITLRGRGTTVEVGRLKKLPGVYKTLIRAVKAGEMDRAIEVAAKAPKLR